MRNYLLQLFVLSLCVMSFSCSLSGPLREDSKAQNYSIQPLPIYWIEEKEISEHKIQRVFIHKHSGAILALNSLCERYADSTLKSLSKELVSPMRMVKIEDQRLLVIDSREGLLTRAKGYLDGVQVDALLLVVRKNDCFFDFTLFAKNALSQQEEIDFNNFIHGFRYGVNLSDRKSAGK